MWGRVCRRAGGQGALLVAEIRGLEGGGGGQGDKAVRGGERVTRGERGLVGRAGEGTSDGGEGEGRGGVWSRHSRDLRILEASQRWVSSF